VRGIADYRFVRMLGEGNHGRFWLAPPPERLGLSVDYVTVKTLTRHASDDDFRRMANELRLYATVDSPYLVKVLDAGQQDGILFYACEYVPGGSIAEQGTGSVAAVMTAVACAARAAHALHEVGVAHRDIKPENIFLTSDGGKLGDLGLAQALNRGQTVTGIGPIGAVEYLAPEMIRGSSGSRASDIWSLGATLHRALTGQSLYPGLPTDDVLASLRHLLATVPIISERLPDVAQAAVEACMQPDPVDRPATALELAEMIEGSIEGGAS
jgi:eukaryotic-like serine/threonine-protein kinase